MERLTKKDRDYGGGAIGEALERLACYEDIGLTPEEVRRCLDFEDICGDEYIDFDRLRELAQADKDGRCVVLPPVKVGEEAFFIKQGKIYSGKVCMLAWKRQSSCDVHSDILAECVSSCFGARFEDFGKTVFLAREEAEAALKGETDGD